MLYLFNSGARPEYVKNVLHTLHLPKGAINKYQYEIDRTNYVDPAIKYPSKKEREKVSENNTFSLKIPSIQYADKRQIAVFFVGVKTVSHKVTVRTVKARPVR